MRVGNIDGFDVIYDNLGKLILKKKEKIEYINENCTGLCLSSSWVNLCSKKVYDGSEGKGRLYITNRRIVHIRRPDPVWVEFFNYNTDTNEGLVKARFARELRKKGAFEYCEIRNSDIEYFDPSPWETEGFIYFLLVKKNTLLKKYFLFFLDDGAEKIISKRVKEMAIPKMKRKDQFYDMMEDILWPIKLPPKKINTKIKER